MEFKPYMRYDTTALKKLLSKTRPYNCATCGINAWNDQPLSLHLDHIDGDRGNNGFDNLRFLCPNCHSQTETYCGRNKGAGRRKFPSDEEIRAATETMLGGPGISHTAVLKALGFNPCGQWYRDQLTQALERLAIKMPKYVAPSKANWPELDKLKEDVIEYGYAAVARSLGVTGTNVKKHLEVRGVSLKMRPGPKYKPLMPTG